MGGRLGGGGSAHSGVGMCGLTSIIVHSNQWYLRFKEGTGLWSFSRARYTRVQVCGLCSRGERACGA